MFGFSLRRKRAQGFGTTDVVTGQSSFSVLVNFNCQLDTIQTHLKRISMKNRLGQIGQWVCLRLVGLSWPVGISVVSEHVYDDLLS